ncbi:MaoC family dehydratase [Pelagibacterium xiamenense]|uniref:MaoC family dehydratase n=1 Tax=Pelagibacterium xiamenense TaxID=2901140 RepID=UPI001E5E7AD3|nr:MaoC family dehydratase [Pelagibacterium xiamenense]MCD7060309.1 MaoC family dehydratase [Pelagibacterium xiamenense]
MPNPITAGRRHYEDLSNGERIALGPRKVTKRDIVAFATEFDPFPFHLDEKAARQSLLGGLAASGWQTGALSLRMLVDEFLSKVASMGGLGFTDLKWKKPVMKNDTISGTATITALRRSQTHPEMGILTLALDMRNQKGQQVMTLNLANLVEVRDPTAPILEDAHEEPAQ